MRLSITKNILLSGRPGVGKTTLVREVTKSIDRKVGGFYTEEIREAGQRVGFSIKTFDGKEGILAHIHTRSPHKVGKYRVNLEDFEKIGVRSLREATGESQIIVIDEIGRMELYSKKFREVVIEALEAKNPVLATVSQHQNKFLDRIKKWPDVRIIEVTRENRDKLKGKLKAMLDSAGNY